MERVLDRIPDRGVRWLLRYGVIPRWLSLPLAREVLAPYLAKAMAGDPAFDDPAADAMPPTKRLGEDAFPTGIEPEEAIEARVGHAPGLRRRCLLGVDGG